MKELAERHDFETSNRVLIAIYDHYAKINNREAPSQISALRHKRG